MISQDRYINIITQTISTTAVDSKQLILQLITISDRMQPNTVIEFTDATTVGSYFGTSSEEYKRAAVYFNFASKSGRRPQKISFYKCQTAPLGAAIYGDNSTKVLDNLVGHANSFLALKTVEEEQETAITLSLPKLSQTPLPTSFKDVAQVIQDAWPAAVMEQASSSASIIGTLGDSPPTITFNDLTQQFVLTTTYSTEGSGMKLIVDQNPTQEGYNIASYLGWGTEKCVYVAAGGAQTMPQAVQASEALNNNFGSFAIVGIDLSAEDITQIATWNAGKNNQYMYLVSVTQSNFETIYDSVKALSGTALTLRSSTLANDYVEMLPGMILAATDYTQADAIKNYMYYQGASFNPSVSDDTLANRLDACLVNYYGQTQQAGQNLAFYQRGVLCGGTGDVQDMTTYANEMWLKGEITTQLFSLFLNREHLDANTQGASIVQAIIQQVIDQAKTNGTIINGVTLSKDTEVVVNGITNNAKGAVNQLQSSGYWLNVTIENKTNDNSGRVEKCAVYTLIYTKADQIRSIQGTHNLI